MSKRKQKKYEREIRDRRAAEEKVRKEDERKAAEKERKKNLTPAQRESEDRMNTIGGFVLLVIIAIVVFVACKPDGGDSDSSSSPVVTSTPSSSASDESVSAATSGDAEQWLKEMLGVDSFTEILLRDATLWTGYVNGVDLDGGDLHVRLQVNRDSDMDLAEQAAPAIANLVRISKDPRVAGVDWVIVEDGAGVYMSQEQI